MSSLLRSPGLLPILALAVCGSTALGQVPMPDKLTRRGADGPFFVTAAAVTNPDGSIRMDPTGRGAWRSPYDMIQRRTADPRARIEGAPGDPCPRVTVSTTHVSGNTRSVAAMIELAPAIYRTEIRSMVQGFSFSNPSTLIAAEITRPLRTAPAFPLNGIVYVLYPKADFQIKGQWFCNAGPDKDYTPAVGDQLLILAYDNPTDETGAFLLTVPAQLIFEHEGRVFPVSRLALELAKLHVRTLDELEFTLMPHPDKRE